METNYRLVCLNTHHKGSIKGCLGILFACIIRVPVEVLVLSGSLSINPKPYPAEGAGKLRASLVLQTPAALPSQRATRGSGFTQ